MLLSSSQAQSLAHFVCVWSTALPPSEKAISVKQKTHTPTHKTREVRVTVFPGPHSLHNRSLRLRCFCCLFHARRLCPLLWRAETGGWLAGKKPQKTHILSSTHPGTAVGGARAWRWKLIMAVSLFVHCKIAYFYSVTTEKWLVVSLPNFVTIRTHFSISCKIFSWIRPTKLKIHAMEFCDFIKDSVSPSGLFVPCSLTVTSTWRPRMTAHCPIGERH